MAGYRKVGERKAEANVLAFPALQTIPPPDLPLTGPGLDRYNQLAKSLFNAGKLNVHTKSLCEQVGALHADQHRRLSKNLSVSTASMSQIERLLKELKLVDDSDAVSPETTEKENRYSAIGVIIRRGAEKAEIR